MNDRRPVAWTMGSLAAILLVASGAAAYGGRVQGDEDHEQELVVIGTSMNLSIAAIKAQEVERVAARPVKQIVADHPDIYGGLFTDNDGHLHVITVGGAGVADVTATASAAGVPVVIQAGEYTEVELLAALEAVSDRLVDLAGRVDSVDVDPTLNRIRIHFIDTSDAELEASLRELVGSVAVFDARPQPESVACGDRWVCSGPSRGGTNLQSEAGNSQVKHDSIGGYARLKFTTIKVLVNGRSRRQPPQQPAVLSERQRLSPLRRPWA